MELSRRSFFKAAGARIRNQHGLRVYAAFTGFGSGSLRVEAR